MSATEYRIVYGDGDTCVQAIDMLMIEVNRCLEEGWHLHGPLVSLMSELFRFNDPSGPCKVVAREMVRYRGGNQRG